MCGGLVVSRGRVNKDKACLLQSAKSLSPGQEASAEHRAPANHMAAYHIKEVPKEQQEFPKGHREHAMISLYFHHVPSALKETSMESYQNQGFSLI